MKTKSLLSLALIAFLTWNSVAMAAAPGTSQLTGTILAITAGELTLQSGADVWVIKRTAGTKITGEATVGKSVTVTYSEADAQKKEGTTSFAHPNRRTAA